MPDVDQRGAAPITRDEIEPHAARFWRLTRADAGGCVLWLAQRNPDGYGVFSYGRRGQTKRYAHRIAFAFATGECPGGDLTLDHRCHVPSCCNAKHLRLVERVEHGRESAEYGQWVGFAVAVAAPLNEVPF